MGATFLNDKEQNPKEKAIKDDKKNMEELKPENGRAITASELEMELEKMKKKLTLTLDVICGKGSSRCWLESCPCGNGLDLASLASLFNSYKNLRYKGSSSLYQLNKTLSWLNFPLNMRLSEFIFEDMIYHRRTRSMNDPCDFLSEWSKIDGVQNIILSHSGWWKLDAFRENFKAMSLLKRSLFEWSGDLHDVVNRPRSRSPSPLWKSMESSGSPLLDTHSLLQKSNSELALAGEETSEVKSLRTKDKKNISCLSSNSMFSCLSTSSAFAFITKGQLQRLQKDGMPYFVFTVDDDPHVAYMARPQKLEFFAKKTIDSIYFFYFKDRRNIDSRKNIMNPSTLIAKMKVSSSIVLKSNMVKIMETEFVLCGSQTEPFNEVRTSPSTISRTRVFPKKVGEMFKQSNLGKIKSNDKTNGHPCHGLNNPNFANDEESHGFIPSLELAAMVVEESLKDTRNNSMFGGWGMKFLEKVGHKYSSSEFLLPQCDSENPSGKGESGRKMNVMIPAGFHGSPHTGPHGGPESIITRWRSGGLCDCGGWDIGCPLTILNCNSIFSDVSAKEAEKKYVNLFKEGRKNTGHPTFSMMKMKDGIYSICFQSTLSVLQSFSIAVAAIHTNC